MNRFKIDIGKLLLTLISVQLYGQSLSFELESVIPVPEWESVEQWDYIAANVLGELYLLDRETGQCIHSSATGEILHTFGGIRLDQGGLAEPVDILVKNTQVIIADYSGDALVWLDRNLNWISNDKRPNLTPTMMTEVVNEIAVYSYDQTTIFRRYTKYWDETPFIDLALENSPLCIAALSGNRAGELATLSCDGQIVTIYSSIGKKLMQVVTYLEEAEFILPQGRSWIILNREGQYHVLKGGDGTLPLNNRKIIDLSLSSGKMIILTEHEILFFVE